MELFIVLLLIGAGAAIRGSYEHARDDFRASRPSSASRGGKGKGKGRGSRPAPDRTASRHATGYWLREALGGFPAARTGWHAGWIAHRTALAQQRVIREEARTEHAETQTSFRKDLAEHQRRQAAARTELQAQLAEWQRQVPDVPPRGKKAVQSAADEVAARRAKRQSTGGKCPGCGAPDGYPCLPGCDPSTASKGTAPEPGVIDTPVRVHNMEDSSWLRPGEKRCEGCGGRGSAAGGTCPACRGFGSAPPDPMSPLAAPDAICGACGNAGKRGDPVLAVADGTNVHLSHATEQQEAYWEALNQMRRNCAACGHPATQADELVTRDGHRIHQSHTHDPDSGFHEGPAPEPHGDLPGGPMRERKPDGTHPGAPSPTTEGEPVTAETNYTTVLTNAKAFAAQADEDAATAGQRRLTAEQHLEDMQAAEVDPATLSAQMDLVDRLRAWEQAAKDAGENATTVSDVLQRGHGGLHEAHQSAPIPQAAVREFYEGD